MLCTCVCYHKSIGQKGDRGDRGPSGPKGEPGKSIEIIHDHSGMHIHISYTMNY